LSRLHIAAVEGMGDAAGHVDAAQLLEQGVRRAAHMKNDRQALRPRQLELRGVEVRLPKAVQAGHEVVEPDLTHGHQPRVVRRVAQSLRQALQSLVIAAVHVQGMDAQRVGAAMAVGQLTHRGKVVRHHRGQHPAAHARTAGAGDHGIAVGVELAGVEMAVAVDPGHSQDCHVSIRRAC
jgi:hypothetical protein